MMKSEASVFMLCVAVVAIALSVCAGASSIWGHDNAEDCGRACRGRVLSFTAGSASSPTKCECAKEAP